MQLAFRWAISPNSKKPLHQIRGEAQFPDQLLFGRQLGHQVLCLPVQVCASRYTSG